MGVFKYDEYYSKREVEELVTRLVSDMEDKHEKQFTKMIADLNKAILSCFTTAVNYEYQEEKVGRSSYKMYFVDKVKDIIQERFDSAAVSAKHRSDHDHFMTYDSAIKNQVDSNGFIKRIVTEINDRQLKVGD